MVFQCCCSSIFILYFGLDPLIGKEILELIDDVRPSLFVNFDPFSLFESTNEQIYVYYDGLGGGFSNVDFEPMVNPPVT